MTEKNKKSEDNRLTWLPYFFCDVNHSYITHHPWHSHCRHWGLTSSSYTLTYTMHNCPSFQESTHTVVSLERKFALQRVCVSSGLYTSRCIHPAASWHSLTSHAAADFGWQAGPSLCTHFFFNCKSNGATLAADTLTSVSLMFCVTWLKRRCFCVTVSVCVCAFN